MEREIESTDRPMLPGPDLTHQLTAAALAVSRPTTLSCHLNLFQNGARSPPGKERKTKTTRPANALTDEPAGPSKPALTNEP